MANDAAQVKRAVARAVAGHRVSDSAIAEVANYLAQLEEPIRRIDVCERGLCCDFFVPAEGWDRTLARLADVPGARLTGIEVFPWGIIDPDLLHVRVMQEFEELMGGGH